MSVLARLNNAVSFAVMAACVMAFVVLGVSGGGWKALAIPTGSMRPGMPPGSLALVRSVPEKSLKIGDVITYTNPLHPSSTITHRIVKKIVVGGKIPGFITKGDSNKLTDVPVVAGAVQGRVVWHISYAGAGLRWAKTWTGIAVLVYGPALLIIIEEAGRLNRYYKLREGYRLFGYGELVPREPRHRSKRLAFGLWAMIAVMGVTGIAGPAAEALFKTNTVALTHNSISVRVAHSCSGNASNNTTVDVNNSSSQTAFSGNASDGANSGGSGSTSGNASNDNSTTIDVSVKNCH